MSEEEGKPKFVFPKELIGHVYKGAVPQYEGEELPKKKLRVSLEGKVRSIVDARNYRGNGHWDFDEPMGGKEYTGFIYVIKDTNANKLYLGKKQYRGSGKVNKGQQSNWQWYISSSIELSESIKIYGKSGFEFYCIEQYKAKGALSYAETWSLMHVQSPVNRHLWYNLLVNKVSWVVKEPITDRHKERLDRIVEGMKNDSIG